MLAQSVFSRSQICPDVPRGLAQLLAGPIGPVLGGVPVYSPDRSGAAAGFGRYAARGRYGSVHPPSRPRRLPQRPRRHKEQTNLQRDRRHQGGEHAAAPSSGKCFFPMCSVLTDFLAVF